MRIGLFTDYFLPHIGGTETSTLNQARALRRAGHTVYIICPHSQGAGQIDDAAEHVVRIASWPTMTTQGLCLVLPTKKNIKKVTALNLDIIHSQSELGVGQLAVIVAKQTNVPLVYTAHTFVNAQIDAITKTPLPASWMALLQQRVFLRKYRATIPLSTKEPQQGIATVSRASRNILRSWMEYANCADIIVAPSQRMADYVGYFLPHKKVVTLPNPFDLPAHHDIPAGHQPLVFSMVGRIAPEKRTDVVIEAFLQLLPDVASRVVLNVYGDGPLLPLLRQKARDAEHIVFHGSVSNTQIQEELRRSDILVIASKGFDNQPMVIVEGLAAGNIIVYCDEYLREGLNQENSYLFDATVAGLVDTITQLAKNDPKTIGIKKQISTENAKLFSYDNYTAKYDAVMRELKEK